MTSMKVLGEYILRRGRLMRANSVRRKTALIKDGMRAAKMAGRDADWFDCGMVSELTSQGRPSYEQSLAVSICRLVLRPGVHLHHCRPSHCSR